MRRVFDYLTDVLSSGQGLISTMRRTDCANKPVTNPDTGQPVTSAKMDDINALYQQVRKN